MECATVKPPKSSSNVSDIVSRVAKVCKLRSIGVFPSENPTQRPSVRTEDSCDGMKGAGFNGGEVNPPVPFDELMKGDTPGSEAISKLFETLSVLKLAYVQLQQAHIPYDPEKIVAADELVVAQLEALCRIKRSYKAKQFTKAKLHSSRLACLRKEIELKERLLENLKSQAKAKDSEVYLLQRELADFYVANTALADKFKVFKFERNNVGRALTVSALEDAFGAASKSIHAFAKLLISLMKASGWDLDRAANSIEDAVIYYKRSDKKYAFEAYIVRKMFHGIQLVSCNVEDVMSYNEPIDALMANPDSAFAKFCGGKYLSVVHPLMEASFFGNLDQRAFVLTGKHPRTPFYQIFVEMAKWVWVIQGIATSMDPKARIFIVKRGSKFSDVHMESVEDGEAPVLLDGRKTSRHVELMIMPGFLVGHLTVKCRVYLSEC